MPIEHPEGSPLQSCLSQQPQAQPHSPRRQALLQAVTEYMQRTGLVNLSLREIARQIGISAPALIHHFGDKETLLREALHSIHQRELGQLEQAFAETSVSQALAGLWEIQSTPGERRAQAAASEIQSVVQNDPARFPNYHQHLSRPWIAAMNAALARAGAPEAQRIPLATLLVATYRGLLNDLLATGETKRINASFHLLLAGVGQLEQAWREGDATHAQAADLLRPQPPTAD